MKDFSIVIRASNGPELKSKLKDLYESMCGTEIKSDVNLGSMLGERPVDISGPKRKAYLPGGRVADVPVDTVLSKRIDEPTPISNVETVLKTEAEKVMTTIPFQPMGQSPVASAQSVIAQMAVRLPVNAGELDTLGLPWDSRIHSASKDKTTTGQYRKRRGLDEATFQTVANELRAAVQAGPAQPAPTVPPPPPTVQVVPQYQTAPTPQTAPPPPPVQQQAQVVPFPTAPQLNDYGPQATVPQSTKPILNFQHFMTQLPTVISGLVKDKLVDQAYLAAKCQWLGVGHLFDVMSDQNKAIALFNQMCAENVIGQANY